MQYIQYNFVGIFLRIAHTCPKHTFIYVYTSELAKIYDENFADHIHSCE